MVHSMVTFEMAASSDEAAHKAMLYFLEILMNSNEPLSIVQLAGRFGSKSFTTEMRQACGGNEGGLRRFLLKYPSLFTVSGNMVSVHNTSLPARTSTSDTAISTENKKLFALASAKQKAIETQAVEYFRLKLARKEERWVPIISLAGHLSQASSDIRLFVGPQSEFKHFVLRYPTVFLVQGERVGLKNPPAPQIPAGVVKRSAVNQNCKTGLSVTIDPSIPHANRHSAYFNDEESSTQHLESGDQIRPRSKSMSQSAPRDSNSSTADRPKVYMPPPRARLLAAQNELSGISEDHLVHSELKPNLPFSSVVARNTSLKPSHFARATSNYDAVSLWKNNTNRNAAFLGPQMVSPPGFSPINPIDKAQASVAQEPSSLFNPVSSSIGDPLSFACARGKQPVFPTSRPEILQMPPQQTFEQPVLGTERAPMPMTAGEYKALMFIKEILERKGPVRLHNITGHFSQAPEAIRSTIGWTKYELEEFIKQHYILFRLDGDLVSLNKNARLNVFITGAKAAVPVVRQLTARHAKVYHVAKLWGIIDLGKHEHVFFDRSIFPKHVDDLQKFFTIGDTVTFNAILAPKNSRAKWRATKVWKDINISAAGDSNSGEASSDSRSISSDFSDVNPSNRMSVSDSIEEEIRKLLGPPEELDWDSSNDTELLLTTTDVKPDVNKNNFLSSTLISTAGNPNSSTFTMADNSSFFPSTTTEKIGSAISPMTASVSSIYDDAAPSKVGMVPVWNFLPNYTQDTFREAVSCAGDNPAALSTALDGLYSPTLSMVPESIFMHMSTLSDIHEKEGGFKEIPLAKDVVNVTTTMMTANTVNDETGDDRRKSDDASSKEIVAEKDSKNVSAEGTLIADDIKKNEIVDENAGDVEKSIHLAVAKCPPSTSKSSLSSSNSGHTITDLDSTLTGITTDDYHGTSLITTTTTIASIAEEKSMEKVTEANENQCSSNSTSYNNAIVEVIDVGTITEEDEFANYLHGDRGDLASMKTKVEMIDVACQTMATGQILASQFFHDK